MYIGDKNYSGPIRALTKWQTGVEIDLQTTLASRASAPRHSDPNLLLVKEETKLGVSPFYTDSLVHTVTVGSARTLESGTESEWISGEESGLSVSGTDSTVTRRSQSQSQSQPPRLGDLDSGEREEVLTTTEIPDDHRSSHRD